jgi:sugar phosphate isomerase/epimerase
MGRLLTLMTGQWADIPLEELCPLVKKMGYDGVELATWGHIDVDKAATDMEYVKYVQGVLEKNGLKCYAIASHLIGQCVGDLWDPRLDGFAPADLAGNPAAIRQWAIEAMKNTARAAKNMGAKVVTGFMGSAVWKYWYSFPQTSEEMIEAAYQEQVDLWSPIFDVFDENGIKFALEVHPTEIAFDYYTTERLFKVFNNRPTLGLNFDPSHLIWQGVNPIIFLHDFIDKVYHVHMKDAYVNLDGKAGILGSHLTFGDTRRGWNFVSMGHGDVDFDKIIRELNAANYAGPLSVEWEDSGMDRIFGATESAAFVRKCDYEPSRVAFDGALKNE